MTSSVDNGVLEMTSSMGKYSSGRAHLDIPKAAEAAGLSTEGKEFVEGYNYVTTFNTHSTFGYSSKSELAENLFGRTIESVLE